MAAKRQKEFKADNGPSFKGKVENLKENVQGDGQCSVTRRTTQEACSGQCWSSTQAFSRYSCGSTGTMAFLLWTALGEMSTRTSSLL